MRNIIYFIMRYNGLLLFLLLEIVAISLLVNNNQKHNDAYFSTANYLVGSIYGVSDDVSQYFSLSSVVDNLAAENAQLKDRLRSSMFEEIVQEETVKDTAYSQQYEYIAAKVVNNSIIKQNNYLTLNRGSKHKVKPNTAVVSANGIVGIVKDVSENYAQVMSILHQQTKISASIKRNNAFGSLQWTTNDPSRMILEEVPKHIEVQIGDTIATTGFSSLFPTGISIGVVDTFWVGKGSSFYHIRVQLSNDLSRMDYVYTINNLYKEEQQALENKEKEDE